MAYMDTWIKMIGKGCTPAEQFEIYLNQFVFKNYNKDVVFSMESCTKEQIDAYVKYMEMYGGGEWHDGVHSEIPYCFTTSKVTDIMPLCDRWSDMQNIIKNDIEPLIYDNYHKFTGKKIAIPYPAIDKEYVFTDMHLPFSRCVNAMQSYYNKLKYKDEIQIKISEIVSSIQSAIVDVLSYIIIPVDTQKIYDLYNSISIDYCAYHIDLMKRYAPSSCYIGRLYLVDTSADDIKYKCIDGRLTTNNIKVLVESTKSDYYVTINDVLFGDNKDDSPMEFLLFDNYNDYGYCIRIMSKSKLLLFVILRELLKKYNYNGVENLNKS